MTTRDFGATVGSKPGGRFDTEHQVAWCVEPLPSGDIALNVARWTRNGRLILRRYQLPPTGGRVEYGKAVWVLHPEAYDFTPDGVVIPVRSPQETAALRQQALTVVQYTHTEVWHADGSSAAGFHSRRVSRYLMGKVLPMVAANAPEGALLRLDMGGRPGYYVVKHPSIQGEAPRVLVTRPKFKLAMTDGLDPSDLRNWVQTSHPVLGGTARLFGEDFAIAPDGRTIYRPGEPEDCWTFPALNTREAELRYREQAPADAARVPGEWAWYVAALGGAVLQITWYSPTRYPVQDVVRVERGLARWRGRVFYVTPWGEMLPQHDAVAVTTVL